MTCIPGGIWPTVQAQWLARVSKTSTSNFTFEGSFYFDHIWFYSPLNTVGRSLQPPVIYFSSFLQDCHTVVGLVPPRTQFAAFSVVLRDVRACGHRTEKPAQVSMTVSKHSAHADTVRFVKTAFRVPFTHAQPPSKIAKILNVLLCGSIQLPHLHTARPNAPTGYFALVFVASCHGFATY